MSRNDQPKFTYIKEGHMKRDRAEFGSKHTNFRLADLITKKHDKIIVPPIPEPTQRCPSSNHKKYAPTYPRDSVPVSWFRTIKDDPKSASTKFCVECRNKKSKMEAERRERLKQEALDKDLECCKRCMKHYAKEEMYILLNGEIGSRCKNCVRDSDQKHIQEVAMRRKVRIERIIENGCSCEKCKKIFLRPLISDSTIVRAFDVISDHVRTEDGTILTAANFILRNIDQLELRILQFDHLPEKEFYLRFPGERFVPKEPLGLHSPFEFTYHRETRKCQQVCGFCHNLETARRHTTPNMNGNVLVKQSYVNQRKREIGCCELCGFWYPEYLPFFHFDHLEPLAKDKAISAMVFRQEYTLQHIMDDLPGCRLICQHCHYIVSDMQSKNGIFRKVRLYRENTKKEVAAAAQATTE